MLVVTLIARWREACAQSLDFVGRIGWRTAAGVLVPQRSVCPHV